MALYGGITLPGRPDLDNVRKVDLINMGQVRRMMRVGVAISIDWFRDLTSRLDGMKSDLQRDILDVIPPEALDQFSRQDSEDSVYDPDQKNARTEGILNGSGFSFNIDSPDQVSELLFGALDLVQPAESEGIRLKKTTTGTRYTTGKKQLEALKHLHPVIPLILKYKEYSKLQNTFTTVIPQTAVWHNKGMCRVCELWHWEDHPRNHSTINTTRTVPGRLSMKKLNLQQIPSRTEMGRETRKGFVAQKGCKIVSRDASQLHLRLIASMAHDPTMLGIFRADGDIHIETARKAFGLVPSDKVDKFDHRLPAKTANFLVAYQGTGQTLYENLVFFFCMSGKKIPDWLTPEWCDQFIQTWFKIYDQVMPYFDFQKYRCREHGLNWDRFGRVRRIMEVCSCHEKVREAGLRQGANHPIIGLEAGMMRIAQAQIEEEFGKLRSQGAMCEAVIPMHDEVVSEVEEEFVEEAERALAYGIETALVDEDTGQYMLECPMKSDGHTAACWEKD